MIAIGPELPRFPRRRAMRWTAFPRGAAACRTCRSAGLVGSGTATSAAIRPAPSALRPAAVAPAGLSAAARHGIERQARAIDGSASPRRPARWSGASRAPTASTPSTS
jgi:hypothetical protein